MVFYVLGTLVIGLLVPSNDPGLSDPNSKGTAAASPFVIAISRAGIKGLPSVINACLLTSAWSAASSDLYTSSRALCKLPSTSFERWILTYFIVEKMAWLALEMHPDSSSRPLAMAYPTSLSSSTRSSLCSPSWPSRLALAGYSVGSRI